MKQGTICLAAQALGRMGRGVKKTITPEDRLRRIRTLEEARARRWPHKPMRKAVAQ